MKKGHISRKQNEAISAVAAEILFVAITVVAAASLWGVLSNFNVDPWQPPNPLANGDSSPKMANIMRYDFAGGLADGLGKQAPAQPSPGWSPPYPTTVAGPEALNIANGQGHYLTVANSPALTPARKISLEVRFMLTDGPIGQQEGATLVSKGAPGSPQYELALNGHATPAINQDFMFSIKLDNGTTASVLASSDVLVNTWYIVNGSYDKAIGALTIHVNGALEGSKTLPAGRTLAVDSGEGLSIGADVAGSHCFKGYLDYVEMAGA